MTRTRWLLVAMAGSSALAIGTLAALPATLRIPAPHAATYELLEPRGLLVLAIWPLLLWSTLGSLTQLGSIARTASLATRTLLLATIAVALSRPIQPADATRISAVYLVDVSDSVTDVDIHTATQHLQRMLRGHQGDDVHIVTFARRPRSIPLPDAGHPLRIERHDPSESSATDMQAALQLAYGLFAPEHIRRVVFVSDGIQTHGDLATEASRAATIGVRVFHHRLAAGPPPEVAVTSLELPNDIDVGEPFTVRARIYASAAGNARVRLYQGSVLNGLDGLRDVSLVAGDNDYEFSSVVRTAGSIVYRLDVAPAGADRFRENNTFSATAVVTGRPSVLIVESDPSHARFLADALTAAEYDVEVRGAAALPRDTRELSSVDFMILSDVPAARMTPQHIDAIERYVRDQGGGFLMAGGDQSFGLGGHAGTRMEDLLPVRMQSQQRQDEHSLALALVLDCSGSMAGQKIELAKEAAKATAELLGAGDFVGVICFASQPETVVRLQSARNRARILSDISRLTARGGTAIVPALEVALRDLSLVRARVKHVILLTDGQTRESGVTDLVQAMRAESITLSTVGLGGDVNRPLLQTAASLGGGRSYFTNDPSHVPRIFTRETSSVTPNSAVEDYVRAVPVDPADFLRGIDVTRAPFLRGYVATQAKPRPTQVILRSELGEPILARWRAGLGWALAWTSDIKNRWAVDWLRWPQFSRFWGQLVREHMRKQRAERLPLTATVLGDEVRVVVDAVDQQDRFINDLESTVRLMRTTTETTPPRPSPADDEPSPLRLTAPGHYEARLPIDGYGAFRIHAVHRRQGQVVAESHAQIARPYPLEYAREPQPVDVLAAAARITGAADAGASTSAFAAGADRITHRRPHWQPLIFAAICLFLLDILVRRAAIARR